ncbi:MAG: shikimate dehydrogenase [Solirubrobacteraceae bacterium]|jgi:shikimate dehydrogenase|nr:shikimate dehydrogenase [Solirubrobacteraceae bacterium]
MTRLGVIGWPVAHSRSPAMHNAGLRAVGLTDWRYQYLPIPPDLLAEAVRALPAAGFVGANVTIPHKEAALALADEATDTARAIGAANTLTFAADGAIHADNTDAPGLLAALGDERPRTAVVLGAGGSARAAVHALVGAGAAVAVWNRTPERARALARELGAEAVAELAPADVLVNCTAVGLDDPSSTFKDLPLSADSLDQYACVVDLVYRAGGTLLIREARRRGAHAVDGLEILVSQGALSFERWTGRAAPTDVMRRAASDESTFPVR